MYEIDSPFRRVFVVAQVLAIAWTFIMIIGNFMRLYEAPEQWSFIFVLQLVVWFFVLVVIFGYWMSLPFILALQALRAEGQVDRIFMYIGLVANVVYMGLAAYIFVRWLNVSKLQATDLCVVKCSPASLLALVFLLRVPTV